MSKNITWGIRQAYAEGRTSFASDLYGYKRVFNIETKKYDTLEIVEDEAKIVREIFERYCAGDSQTAICDSLNERNVPPPGKSNKKWYPSSLQTILRNEKYKGDVLTQKTYCSNLLEHKRVKNTGQVAQHYLQDHHPAIVDRDLFDRVQAEYARRNAKKVNNGIRTKHRKRAVTTVNTPLQTSLSAVTAEVLTEGACGPITEDERSYGDVSPESNTEKGSVRAPSPSMRKICTKPFCKPSPSSQPKRMS